MGHIAIVSCTFCSCSDSLRMCLCPFLLPVCVSLYAQYPTRKPIIPKACTIE